MSSRKDYIDFVDILGKFTAMVDTDYFLKGKTDDDVQSHKKIGGYIGFLVSDICKTFKRDNPRFDESYFMQQYNKNKLSWTEYFTEQANKL